MFCKRPLIISSDRFNADASGAQRSPFHPYKTHPPPTFRHFISSCDPVHISPLDWDKLSTLTTPREWSICEPVITLSLRDLKVNLWLSLSLWWKECNSNLRGKNKLVKHNICLLCQFIRVSRISDRLACCDRTEIICGWILCGDLPTFWCRLDPSTILGQSPVNFAGREDHKVMWGSQECKRQKQS